MAFTRLAYHRSWFLIVVGGLGLGLLVLFVLDRTVFGSGLADDQLAIPVVGVPLALLAIARGVTGSWARHQLRVDVPAGKLQLANGDVVELEELGTLAVTGRTMYGHSKSYELRAENLDGVLFESVYEGDAQIRMTRLERAILLAKLRRALGAPTVEGDAFRAGPELRSEVLRIAGDAMRARSALGELARDQDATIRDRAAKLFDSL